MKWFFFYCNGLKKLKLKYNNKIKIIVFGDSSYQNIDLECIGIKWTIEKEKEVLSSFDIGLMPLKNNEWERGKCGMKALLYMSMSVATVVSPVGVNPDIINHGINGFIAHDEDDWINLLSLLIEDTNLRKKLAENGRLKIVSDYSINSYANKFNELLGK